jgi:CRP-like cAMP-binding protein
MESKDLNSAAPPLNELASGQHKLSTNFRKSPASTLNAGVLLGSVAGSSDAICRLRHGWACQFLDFANGRRAITDVYLPGDVIGLDAVLQTRPLERVLTLTSVTIETIRAEDALTKLMADRSISLCIAWLLGQRQRRADRLLASISGLDARGQLATMLLDFYKRLRRRGLIAGQAYNLPLTQIQIGNYLGLTVVHTNRVLRSLSADGIVNLQRHCVTILDLQRLASLTQRGEVTNSSYATSSGVPQTEIELSASKAAVGPPPVNVRLPATTTARFPPPPEPWVREAHDACPGSDISSVL